MKKEKLNRLEKLTLRYIKDKELQGERDLKKEGERAKQHESNPPQG